MDALYSHILFAASDNIDKVLDVFAVLLFHWSRDPDRLPTIQFLESFLSYRPGEVLMVLSGLHFIISVPLPFKQYRTIQFFHASLGDFLVYHSRSGDIFCLDPGISHRRIATQILKEIEAIQVTFSIFPHFSSPDQCCAAFGMVSLGEEFAYHWIKSTPTPEFLLRLQRFDISFKIGDIDYRTLHSESQIPECLVWLHQKVSHGSTLGDTRIWIRFICLSSVLSGRKTIALTFTSGIWMCGFMDI